MTTPERGHSGLAAWLRIGLGVLLAVMAAGQLSDVGGFTRALRDYALGDGVAVALAVVLIVGESAAAAGLLLPLSWVRSRRTGGVLALAVAVLWSALAVQAFARGLVIPNCGCYGVHFAQRLSPWILVQDVSFVSWAFTVARDALRRRIPVTG